MNERLATERGRRLCGRRKYMIEPVFAQHGLSRFSRRGRPACDTEWQLINITDNQLELLRN